MTMNLIKHEGGDDLSNGSSGYHQHPAASVQTLEGFNQMLNEAPPAHEIEVNKFANNSKYLPISFTQMELDEVFVGLWETKNFEYKVIANELVGSVTLRYYHPFAKVWLERIGGASVMIQQDKGASITDMSAKIKNTLGKDHPHLLASCICSAARTIGKRFGRDLNRKMEDNYNSLYSDMAASESATGSIEWDKVKNKTDLKSIWDNHPKLHNNIQFVKTFTYQKNKLAK